MITLDAAQAVIGAGILLGAGALTGGWIAARDPQARADRLARQAAEFVEDEAADDGDEDDDLIPDDAYPRARARFAGALVVDSPTACYSDIAAQIRARRGRIHMSTETQNLHAERILRDLDSLPGHLAAAYGLGAQDRLPVYERTVADYPTGEWPTVAPRLVAGVPAAVAMRQVHAAAVREPVGAGVR